METQISYEDLRVLIHIIDRGAERGIFAGTELSGIGAIRDRLAKITQPIEEKADSNEAGSPE